MDALQLAAALVAAEGKATALPLVTLDRRLGEAARLEGFSVLGWTPGGPVQPKTRRVRSA
jgi:hypothetical protein